MRRISSSRPGWRRWQGRLPAAVTMVCFAAVLTALGADDGAHTHADDPDAASAPAEPRMVVAENDIFSVIGLKWNEARAVERISAALRDVTGDWLALPSRPRQLVAVQLVTAPHYTADDAYHIAVDGRGGIVVSLRWDEALGLESVCEALARAYLIKRLWQFDPALDPEIIPDWLVFSLGASLEVAWLPGRREAFRERAKAHPPLAFGDIFGAVGPYGETRDWIATEAYWLLRFLRAEWRRLPESLWLTALTGNQPDWALLAKHSPTPVDATMRELWWAVGRADQLHSRSGAVLSLDESREILIRLAYITYEDKAGDLRLPANAVLEFDDPAPFAADASNHTRLAKMLLVRINPVYHNSLVALGFFYEALAAGDFTAAANHYQQFLDDFNAASTLHAEVDRLIGDTEDTEHGRTRTITDEHGQVRGYGR